MAASVRDNSVEGRKEMRACDHQALQDGLWGEVVAGSAPNPEYMMKIVQTYSPKQIFEPCQN